MIKVAYTRWDGSGELMNNKKRLTDFHEQWIKIVEKANINYNGINNYNTLTNEEKVWYHIQLLIASVDNGGMISFFYNHEAEYFSETIESLKELKHEKIIKLMKKIAKLFPKGIVPKNIDKRNEIINNIQDRKYEKLHEKIDREFYKVENKLEADLIEYIIKNKLV
jgi:hypothetical protein